MSLSLEQITQNAQFFSSMLHLVPAVYLQPEQQQQNSKFLHSSKTSAAPRQSFKENSKSGLKNKAKFDPKNFTSVLSNGNSSKRQRDEDSDEEMDDSDDDDDDDEEDDSEVDSDDSDAAPRKAAPAKKPTRPTPHPAQSGPLLAGAPLPPLMPVPTLSQVSADRGMDQLRQRLHERIDSLSNKRKPEEKPFSKKKKKDKTKGKKEREKNERKPSSHPTNAKHARDESAANEERPAKKQKSSTASSATSSSGRPTSSTSSPSLTSSSAPRVSAADLADDGDFQFAAIKAVNPAVAGGKAGSYSLQGKAQRRKNASDADLLRKAESFEAKVSALKAAGQTEAAEQLQQQRSMEHALLRAQGVRVKDDSKLLKKSLKRDEKRKEKSRAEWGERLAKQKSEQDKHHAGKIASYDKKGKGDRSKTGTTAEDEKNKEEKAPKGRGGKEGRGKEGRGKESGGRAGFEGKGKKKFLN